MIDQVLLFLVVFIPVVLGFVVIYVPPKNEDKESHMRWRRRLGAVLILYAILAWIQQSRSTKTSTQERETAVGETAAKTAASVSKTMIDQYEPKIDDLKMQVQAARKEEASDSKTIIAESKAGSDRISIELAADRKATASARVSDSVTAEPATPAASPRGVEAQSLKRQGLLFAQEINDWITVVSKDMPEQSLQDYAANAKYAGYLNSQWSTKYASQANSLVRDLRVTGLLIACRSSITGDPRSVLNFRKICADHIESAAMNLN